MPHTSDIRDCALSGATGTRQEGHDLEDNLGVAEVDLRRIFRRANAPVAPDVDHPHICTGTGLTPMPHLHRDRAHPRSRVAAETGGRSWRTGPSGCGGSGAGTTRRSAGSKQATASRSCSSSSSRATSRCAPHRTRGSMGRRGPYRAALSPGGSSGTRSTLAATYWRQVLANGGLTPEHMDKLFQKSFPPHHSPYPPSQAPRARGALPRRLRGSSAMARPRAAGQMGRRAIHH